MKAHFHKVAIEPAKSFNIRLDQKPNFGTLWHYHPELELHYIIKGEGTQYIGDSVSNFKNGDMVLLGENLPHTWRCKEEYFKENNTLDVCAYVLQFHPTFLGQEFLQLPEAQAIPALFEKAKQGLVISGNTKLKVAELLQQLEQATDLNRIILLLEIIEILSETDEYQTISPSYAFSHLTNLSEMHRLEKIYSFVLANYRGEINLSEIASLSNLSTSSFCRYFRTMTNKTFFEFVIEIRISNACRELIQNQLTTQAICYESGFNTLSNFYRHFKKVKGMTPFEYKKQYLT
ncbi:AraC family transcriptional regulator [Algoriphagus aquimarinus]|uniref:AraC family transcriptional regulator n=1 Tax=Algoriphagus aquimarinus TaxID=237018 RepID=A0A5C7AER4_9BACT|nr:AraC family transcriptional regulator [Algoriphagus aquimarinus]TXE06454.1 AraC family transcriptional regulator [Algoriphagus aquimarinus]